MANETQLIYRRSETGTGGNGDLHLWTTDANEYSTLASDGWSQEGIVGYVL